MWQLLEPVHAVTYFDPVAWEPLQQRGVEGFWAPYVLQRAAPLGPVGPAVVTAAFFGFHPRRAAAVLPEAWDRTPPDLVLACRLEGAAAALRPLVTEEVAEELAALLGQAARAADCAGRPLAAANAALPVPGDPVAALWQATTVLREHRGDGHVAALVAAGIGPVEAMHLKAAAGESVGEHLRLGRAWDEQSWQAGTTSLTARGWLTDDGRLTEAGEAARREVEDRTDAAAEGPWEALDAAERDRVVELLAPVAQAVWDQGRMPPVNPIGVPPA